jgi:hypothetical protein
MFLIPLDTIGDPVIAITTAVLDGRDVGIRPLHRIPLFQSDQVKELNESQHTCRWSQTTFHE